MNNMDLVGGRCLGASIKRVEDSVFLRTDAKTVRDSKQLLMNYTD